MRNPIRSHPFAFRWVISAGLLFVITMMWGIASPVPSGPDEEAQLVKAAAVAHGTLIGTLLPGKHISAGTVTVKVPETIRNARQRGSCDYNIYLSATCTQQVVGSSRMVTITTYEGRYPPLYYLLTGLPTDFTSAPAVLHYMRAMSALIVAVLLGMAFAAVTTWGRSSLLLIALTVTVTPTVLYLGAVVNPSAMEVAGGILLWAALTVLVLQRADDPPPTLIASAVVGSVALCASRPLSTLFFAIIVASFLAIRPRSVLTLLAKGSVKIGLAVSLVAAFVSALFVLYAKSYEVEAFPFHDSTEGYVTAIIGRGGRALRQVIGSFGSPNFSVPDALLAVWLITAIGLLALGLILARRRDALVLLGLFALLGFVLPFVVIYSHVKNDGVVWQGRYSLPLIAGIPILSGALVGDRYPDAVAAVRRRLGLVVLPGLCFGWIGAFYWFLRRYTVSLSPNATNAFHHDLNYWTPPIAALDVFALLVVATLAFAGWIFREMATADLRRVGGAGQVTAPRPSSQPITESTSPPQPL